MPYLKLDDSKNEIRLITVLPQLCEREPVRCRLETRSLSQLSETYAEYIASSTNANLSRRKATLEWRQRLQGSDTDNHVYYTNPPKQWHRFVWGDYVALSYAWGDERQTNMIEVDGDLTQVTHNLEKALRAFRAGEEFCTGMKLWVDAICINQKDLKERSNQIMKMRDIYGSAWTVITWLGEASDESAKAIDLVRNLALVSKVNGGIYLEKQLLQNPPHLGKGGWLALQYLMERSYWYRLWAIQEIVMGASSVMIRCGTSSIDWRSFCRGVALLYRHLWTVKDFLLHMDLFSEGLAPVAWTTTSLHLVCQDLIGLCHEEGKAQRTLTFGRILDIASSADCQDPRDKVYGLVGLMETCVASQIHPDYSIEPARVYSTTAQAFIRGNQNLEPLREGNPWGPTGCPSWAADWQWEGRLRSSRIENELWLPWKLFANSGTVGSVQTSIHTPYHASGETRCRASFSSDGLLTTCDGFIIDAVSSLSAREVGYWKWSQQSLVQPGPFKSTYGGFNELAKALYCTLTLDRVFCGERASPRHASIFHLPSTFVIANPQFTRLGWNWLAAQRGYYFRYQGWRAANKDFWLGEHKLNDFFTNDIPESASEYDTTEAYSCIDRACKKRRLMTTQRGYIGWGPDNIFGSDKDQTMQGDLIAIIFGCSTPIVMRPKGEYFQVIGEAYVHGFMNGEAMQLLDDRKLHPQSFTLC